MSKTRLIAPCDLPQGWSFAIDSTPIGVLDHHPNLGLLWQRYFPAHDSRTLNRRSNDDGISPGGVTIIAPMGRPNRKWHEVQSAGKHWAGRGALDWFCKRTTPVDRGLHELRTKRRFEALKAVSSLNELSVKSVWRSAIGLGNVSTFETSGVSLHHTYGFPILPGASLKGMARHYLLEGCAELEPDHLAAHCGFWGQAPMIASSAQSELLDAAAGKPGTQCSTAELVKFLFGHSDQDASAGALIFYDGWPTQCGGWFEPDVLTVHHQDYYGQSSAAPKFRGASDRDEPNPVFFLTLKPTTEFVILLGLSPIGRALPSAVGATTLEVGARILRCALNDFGIGAKTGAGYGRFV